MTNKEKRFNKAQETLKKLNQIDETLLFGTEESDRIDKRIEKDLADFVLK